MTGRRRTKTVCTLGPATRSPAAIRELVDAGMDVARLNFSHGTHEDHAVTYQRLREASERAGRPVGVLVDLQGPKIRLRNFQGGVAVLQAGSTFVVSGEPFEGTSERGSVTYGPLAQDLGPGDTVLIDDGMVKLRAVASDGQDVSCQVEEGGPISDCKGVNLPGAHLGTAALTEKDVDDLRFALEMGTDIIALSFVRSPDDVIPVRKLMDQLGPQRPVIAKIEKPEAVERLEAITDAFDGLMVARGDLGVEMPLEQVPLVQKRAVKLGREQAKPVIVATQMLESMIHNRRPTRAEVSDVANAVLDGADALMLAGETGVGEYPGEALRTMARVIETTEQEGLGQMLNLGVPTQSRQEAIALAALRTGALTGARGVIALTQTGRTARCLARHRSPLPLLALTTSVDVQRRLTLTWDVETCLVPPASEPEDELAQVNQTALRRGYRPGDAVVVVAGETGKAGSTHTMRVHELPA